MIHTKDGSKIGILCIKHGSAQERKKIIKGMKGHVSKIASDRFGSMIIIRELQPVLKDLIFDKNGRRPLLQLLHPNCSRYLSPDDLSLLDSSIPSLLMKGGSEPETETKSSEDKSDDVDMSDAEESAKSVAGGNKDPTLRRKELLVDSGLAESLIDACCESSEELLRSNHGKEILFEMIYTSKMELQKCEMR